MRRLREGEDGAVAVMVAVLLVVMLGMAALAVDVGHLYQERRELQNGADAAALAIAEDCARSIVTCAIDVVTPIADQYADDNATDLEADAAIDPNDFNPNGRVTVITSSRDAATGDPYIYHWFAPVLGSGSDFDRTTVEARTTVVWGYPSSLGTVPLTISNCEYDTLTAQGTLFAEPTYEDDTEATLTFHDGNASNPQCLVGPGGQDMDGDGHLPAGFGWLVSDGFCQVITKTVDGEDWVAKHNSVSPPCDWAELEKIVGKVVPVPVFDDYCRHNDPACTASDGTHDMYKISHYAAFYVTGYDLGNHNYERYDGVYRTVVPDCGTNSQDDHCLTGFFTTASITQGDLGGEPGSVLVIKMTN